MSHNFKAPKVHPKLGSEKARLRRYAQSIENQAQLDAILAQVDPKIGREWLGLAKPHLRFKPLQLQVAEESKNNY